MCRLKIFYFLTARHGGLSKREFALSFVVYACSILLLLADTHNTNNVLFAFVHILTS